MAEESERVIAEHGAVRPGRPLFLYLSFSAPAPPLQPEPEHLVACANLPLARQRDYCGLVVGADAALGRVVAALQRAGWWDHTTVAVSTAGGGNPWEGGRNYPFRGGYATLWEGGVRGLGLVRNLPRYGRAGHDYLGLVHAADLLPTLAALVGVPESAAVAAAARDGHNLADVLARPAEPSLRTTTILALDAAFPSANRSAVRHGDWKLVLGRGGDPRLYKETGDPSAWAGWRSIVDWLAARFVALLEAVLGRERAQPYVDAVVEVRYHFNIDLRDPRSAGVFLFNLAADPHERHDVAEQHPDVVKQLRGLLAAARSAGPLQLDVRAHHPAAAKPQTGLLPDQPAVPFWGAFLDDAVPESELLASGALYTPMPPVRRIVQAAKAVMNFGFVVVIYITFRVARRGQTAAPGGGGGGGGSGRAVSRNGGRPKRD